MQLDTSSKFARFSFTPDELEIAYHVSPMFLAMLQNKIETYANELVEKSLPYSSNPTEQVAAIIAHERLRNFVEAYTELLSEIIENQPAPSTT